MAKTDTPQQAATDAMRARELDIVPPTVHVWPADGTHMTFFTENGKITCEASLYLQISGGNARAIVEPRRAVKFAMEDALPPELLQAAQLIQAYIHNHACAVLGAELP